MKKKWKKQLVSIWRGWGITLIAALLIATSFKSAIADWNDIPTGSMEPTILVGDRIFVNKLAYDLKIPYTTFHLAKWSDPKRGDIVIFYSPRDGKRMVKRVVGLPGDRIGMHNNRLFINGEFMVYQPISGPDADPANTSQVTLMEHLKGKPHEIQLIKSRRSLDTFGPVVVPAGHYFMMGDNRDNSADSRFFGFVEREQIVGRATMVALSRSGSFLHPRWDRFFKEIL